MNNNKIFRGDEWDVNLSFSKKYLNGTLKILNTNNRRIYSPLSETPDVFLRFSEIGFLYWNQLEDIKFLKEKTNLFLNNFSYLHNLDLNQEISMNSFINEAKTAANIISIIRLNNKNKISTIPLISNRISTLSEQRNQKNEDEIHKWMIETIQQNLENEPCVNQIESSKSNNSYNITVRPKSLKAAIWFQIANIIISKKYIKDCSYLLCKKLYSTTRSKRNYCSSSCQTRAKSYRAYHNLSAEQSNQKKISKKISQISSQPKLDPVKKENKFIKEIFEENKKLKPIKKQTSIEYDPDYGFFEDQESEKRILGD